MLLTNLSEINRLAKGELMRMKKMFIINMIILIASAFFVVVGVAAESVVAFLGIIFIGFMIVTVIPSVALLFRDLTDKRVCDVMHSLPMTASQRFWAKIWALCEYHIVPTLVIALAEIIIMDMRFNTSSDLSIIANESMYIYLVGVTWLLFTAAVSLLCQMCFGTLAEGIYMALIALAAFSIFPVLVYQNITYSAGFERMFEGVPMFFCLWTYTSAAVFDDGKVFSFIIGHEHRFSAWPVLIVNILISLGVIWLCSRLYKKRTAETVGTPISFRIFLEVLSVISVYVMFNFLVEADMTIAIGASLAVFMVVHIILARGKKIKMVIAGRLLEFGVIIAVVLIVNEICNATGGFGLAYSEPKGDLEHSSIYVDFYDSQSDYFSNDKYYSLILLDVDEEKVTEITRIIHSHFKTLGNTRGWRRYYYSDHINFLVDERREFKKNESYNNNEKYYWSNVYDQDMCYDCDAETLYQELIDAGMEPDRTNDLDHDYYFGDDYGTVYY